MPIEFMEIEPNETTFSASFHERYEIKLQDIWPVVESSLDDYGIACALNLAERSVTISKTARCKGRNYFIKATRLVELLTTTHVPPQMAIETLKGDRRHVLIKIGNQQGGLCSKFGINKEKFIKQWQRLACSLEALAARTNCNLFLNENNLAAVGSAPATLRNIVVDCIVKDKNPETYMREEIRKTWQKYAKKYGANELQQPDVDDIGMEKCGPSVDSYGMLEVTTYCSSILIGREKEVEEAWPFVQWFLKGYGISSAIHTAERRLTISTTRKTLYPDILHQAGPFIELLARTSIPATKAAEILNGRLQYEVIKTGFQEGGLCAKFEIEKNHHENMELLKRNSKEIARLMKCDIYINGGYNVVAVLKLFRSIVECCYMKNEDPVAVARRLKLDHKLYKLMKKIRALSL